eukprot:3928536-Prymnesium_polylepis.1
MPPPCPHADAHQAPRGPSTCRLARPAAPPHPAPAALSSPHAARCDRHVGPGRVQVRLFAPLDSSEKP